jgi:6-phosphogluconolactonase
MITRRSFLATLPAAAVTLRSLAQPAHPQFVYFGTDTTQGVSKGIYRSTFDPAAGTFTPPVLAAATPAPSFLAISPIRNGLRFLFAVNELNGAEDTITSFAFDPATGSLRQLNQVSATAAGPCYISVDPTAHSAFVADYAGHALASYRILPNGHLTPPVSHFNCSAPFPCEPHGPNPDRQESSHFHCSTLSPDNRFLLVNDLGADTISVYSVDTRTAVLKPHQTLKMKPGSGPRHVAFHPHQPWVYSINELASSIDHLHWDSSGALTNLNATVSTLSPSFHGQSTAAEVTISADGRFLYASNRGEDTLVVFSINPASGALKAIQRISCGGHTPRHFTLDPSGHWLINGNQTSATVTVFRRDPATGHLSGPTQTLPLDSPMYTLFA